MKYILLIDKCFPQEDNELEAFSFEEGDDYILLKDSEKFGANYMQLHKYTIGLSCSDIFDKTKEEDDDDDSGGTFYSISGPGFRRELCEEHISATNYHEDEGCTFYCDGDHITKADIDDEGFQINDNTVMHFGVEYDKENVLQVELPNQTIKLTHLEAKELKLLLELWIAKDEVKFEIMRAEIDDI